MHIVLRHGKKVGTAIAGSIVIVVGLILIPYPGPGWLVVFAGLTILATEFEFAARVLAALKQKYAAWKVWLKQRPVGIQILVLAFTGFVIVITLWLLNTFGLVEAFFRLHQDWLDSPFLLK